MKQPIIVLFALLLVFTFACQQEKAFTEEAGDGEISPIRYAQGLKIVQHDGWMEVVVRQPWKGSTTPVKYALVSNPEISNIPADYKTVEVPLEKAAATSTTHLPHFLYLDIPHRLKGFANSEYIYSPLFREMMQKNELTEIGDGTGVNYESAISLQPDAIFTFSMGKDRTVSDRLEQAGIPQLYNADYLESTPLGRAEWIKFTAAFFGELEAADSVFSEIEKNYLELLKKGGQATSRPSVLTGVVYGETWFLPGGKNYGALFFEDAGGSYLWNENMENGWLELSFESVYEQAANADFWIGTATFGTIAEMIAQEKRYELFAPINSATVYNYDRQVNDYGGNNYLEEGYSRPDLVLADLLHILHPEALPDHQLYFYRKLP